MRVLLKLVLDCAPDDAWRAIRSPDVFAAVSAPLTYFRSLEPDGFPGSWPPGPHRVMVCAARLVDIGEQTIDISYPDSVALRRTWGPGDANPAVRIMRDTGRGLSGPLTVVTRWEHTMAIAPAPGGRTLYRDQLVFAAGVLTPLLWPLYWGFWQWRAIGMRRLAPSWGASAAGAGAAGPGTGAGSDAGPVADAPRA